MTCKKCNNTITETDKFCPYCGERLGQLSEPVPEPKSALSKRAKLIIGISAGVFVVALAVVLMFVLDVCDTPGGLTVDELLELGDKYLLELNYEQALVQFLKVIEIEPMNPRGYTGAADAYTGLDIIDSSIAILERGARSLPGNARIEDMLKELQILVTTPAPAIESTPAPATATPAQQTQSAQETQPPQEPADSHPDSVVEWQSLYADKLIELDISYNNSEYWSTEFPYLRFVEVADLNFDGIPEIIVYGGNQPDGSGLEIRCYTIRNNNAVQFLHAVGEPLAFSYAPFPKLYINKTTGKFAYILYEYYFDPGGQAGPGYWKESYFQTYLYFDNEINLNDYNSGFEMHRPNAIFETETMDYYNEDYSTNYTENNYYMNGRSVTAYEYNTSFDELFEDFYLVDYPIAYLSWRSTVTHDDLVQFFNTYQPETLFSAYVP